VSNNEGLTTEIIETIWKYELPGPGERLALELPIGAQVLTVQYQNGVPTIWVKLLRSAPIEVRHFVLVGTGWPVHPEAKYIGTVQSGPYVWHLLEVPD
jgi:hypothetical protein